MVNLRNGPLSPEIRTGPVLLSFPGVGSYLILLEVIKIFSILDGDVGNLRKFEYFHDYL